MDDKVISLTERREAAKERQAEGHGPGFAFDMRDDLADDDAPVGVTDDGLVVLVLDESADAGIALSAGAARALGVTLIELAAQAEAKVKP